MTQAMLETAELHPGRPAIVGDRESLTYRELIADSARLFAVVDALHREQEHPPAPAPETRGIPIAAISAESAFATARFIVGLAGFRAVSATIDPRWPLEHRVDVIVTTGVGLVVTDTDDLAPALAERGWTGTVIGLGDFTRRIDELGDAPAGASSETVDARSVSRQTGPPLERPSVPLEHPSVRDGDEAFLMLFSSGTTSNPKAFLKTRDQYRANAAVSAAHLEPLPGVATLAPGPVSYSLTLYAVVECMVTGGSVHVADGFDPLALARRIDDEAITRIVVVPAVVRALTDAARRAPERFARLDLVVTGGANLPASIRDGLAEVLPHVRLISYYGAAEIGFIGDSRDGDGTLISIYDGIGAQIREESGDSAADGEIGTLWIRAAACSAGYLAGTTDEVLVGPDGWATVQDQGRIVDGRLELVGRAGDIAITGGHKVALPEVERAFDDVVGLRDVCAVPLPDPALGTVVALVVESGTSEAPAKDTLRAHAQERLAPQYVPRRWFRVGALPRTVGGKIRRPATRDLVLAGKAERL